MAAAGHPRELWVDVAKGMGICLMVFGHVWGGLSYSGVLTRTPPVLAVYTWIYTFHMPTLMFLSGLFLEGSLRRGWKPFLLSRVGTLYIPSILWTAVTVAVTMTFRNYINSQPNPAALIDIFYQPQSAYWFLSTLFQLSLAYCILRSLSIPPAAVLPLFGGLLAYGLLGSSPVASQLGWYGVCLFAGVLLKDKIQAAAMKLSSATLAAVAVACCGWITAAVYEGWADNLAFDRLLCAPFGMAMLLSVSMLASRFGGRLVAAFSACGRYSLEVYVLHSLLWVPVRILFLRGLHIPNPWFIVPSAALTGIVASVGAAMLLHRLRLGWVFRFPLGGAARA